jgi:hypothetical protein
MGRAGLGRAADKGLQTLTPLSRLLPHSSLGLYLPSESQLVHVQGTLQHVRYSEKAPAVAHPRAGTVIETQTGRDSPSDFGTPIKMPIGTGDRGSGRKGGADAKRNQNS